MGARGPLPQPIPDNVRALKGEATHSAPRPALKAAPVRPTMPRGMDPTARRVWRTTVADLEALGILARADREFLAAYCRACSLAERAWAALFGDEPEEMVVTGAQGGLHANPLILIWRQATDQVEKLARQLGATPAARLRMRRPDNDGADEADLD